MHSTCQQSGDVQCEGCGQVDSTGVGWLKVWVRDRIGGEWLSVVRLCPPCRNRRRGFWKYTGKGKPKPLLPEGKGIEKEF